MSAAAPPPHTRAAPRAQGGFRWALSGTPIQNSLGELFSLLHFLRYAPFDSQAAWRDLLRQAALADNLVRTPSWQPRVCLGSAPRVCTSRPRQVAAAEAISRRCAAAGSRTRGPQRPGRGASAGRRARAGGGNGAAAPHPGADHAATDQE